MNHLRPLRRAALTGAALWMTLAAQAAGAPAPFRLDVLDAETGRGVPLVELRTTNSTRYYTDSNGIAAIRDPELMGQTVYLHIKSHGYQHPADDFGYRGAEFRITPGGRATVRLQRVNIAERLYRVTGAGIYRDSLLVGAQVPIRQPLLNGLVMGQDTVEVTPYRGKLYWFWGDTDRPSYPLGLFRVAGATSPLPGPGGTDPARGVDLSYWTDPQTGFARAMVPLEPGLGGPIWIAGLFTLQDAGRERLIAHYSHHNTDVQVAEHGLAVFNDRKGVFEKRMVYDLKAPIAVDGHPFQTRVDGARYLYFPTPDLGAFPLGRVRAEVAHITDPATYEGFTCLQPGARYEGEDTRLERDSAGALVWGWKRNTAPLSYKQEQALIAAGKLNGHEALVQLRDVETGATFQPQNGSTYWNPYRRRWIMLVSEVFGKPSFLGELWFAEADTPVGPWVYARKIVTHDRYSFYNPTQHPFFDQDAGRIIYFEGTYTSTFSGNEDKTPRYDYNQIMYRLTLDDPRLSLPAPVYRVEASDGESRYAMRETVAAGRLWRSVRALPFFAAPPARKRDGLIPIYAGGPAPTQLQAAGPANAQPLFYALPAEPAEGEKPSPDVVPLHEYHDTATGRRWYAVEGTETGTVQRSAKPLCRVWRNPLSALPLDAEAEPA